MLPLHVLFSVIKSTFDVFSSYLLSYSTPQASPIVGTQYVLAMFHFSMKPPQSPQVLLFYNQLLSHTLYIQLYSNYSLTMSLDLAYSTTIAPILLSFSSPFTLIFFKYRGTVCTGLAPCIHAFPDPTSFWWFPLSISLLPICFLLLWSFFPFYTTSAYVRTHSFTIDSLTSWLFCPNDECDC